tara:strand:+ start:761 stop:901 length:141 start_codon:yes stop_codon:yes gene_type:complete
VEKILLGGFTFVIILDGSVAFVIIGDAHTHFHFHNLHDLQDAIAVD